ncbi:LysR family transcriptional regulator [Sorangium sp. So ce341]|uniref:LysR family transcriptional regulator n=1 Tax=Sorangium sp. So ce341 TaxID=3133302 RepID=UPI003F60677B
MNLSRVDLNLFLVLHAVLEERSATQAARRLHVTQSAVSNALARLRHIIGDPLVVRGGRGLVPTPRALQLRPLVDAAVSQLQAIIDARQCFDPAQSTRQFTLACGDNHAADDVPGIVEELSRRMPRASLRVVTAEHAIASNGLATGDVDAAIVPRGVAAESDRFSQELYMEDVVLVVGQQHPRVRRGVNRELFNSLKHIDILIAQGRPGIGHRIAERHLAEHGLRRDVVLAVPHFFTAAAVAARTDYVVGMPRRAAERFCALLPLRIVDSPLHGLRMLMDLVWHARTHADPETRHFRNVVIDALRNPVEHGRRDLARKPRRNARIAPSKRAVGASPRVRS